MCVAEERQRKKERESQVDSTLSAELEARLNSKTPVESKSPTLNQLCQAPLNLTILDKERLFTKRKTMKSESQATKHICK